MTDIDVLDFRTPAAVRDGVHKVSRADVMDAPGFPALIEEYARESAIDGLPSPRVKLDGYIALDRTGFLHVYSATTDGQLIGFITILAPVLPHYGVTVAVTESFFVASEHRRGGPGLRLLAAAEEQARVLGAPGLLVSAPFGGRLFELLPKCGYVETNRVFFKKVSHG